MKNKKYIYIYLLSLNPDESQRSTSKNDRVGDLVCFALQNCKTVILYMIMLSVVFYRKLHIASSSNRTIKFMSINCRCIICH